MTSTNGPLSRLLGRTSSSKTVSTQDAWQSLDALCSLPTLNYKAETPLPLPSSKFVHISNLLRICYPGWESRPRLFTVLKWIDRLDLMGDFIAQEVTDISLSLPIALIPLKLGNARLRI
jgi:hypothetical protein